METTFNLKSFMKTANMAYEGSQGYFLAQQRAWMNCSKCKREEGKSAQDAWQECFDEFQDGDRKMSWLENYAADEAGKISKESAIDYSEEVIKLASSGLGIKDAVESTLQQRLAWPWNRNQQQQTNSPAPAVDYEAQAKQQAKDQNAQASPKLPVHSPKFTREQLDANEKRKQAVLQQKQNNQTYNILHNISELIKQDVYDSDKIRQLIVSIQNPQVKTSFEQIISAITKAETDFSKMVEQMSQKASEVMEAYKQSGFKTFMTPEKPMMGADFAKQPIQLNPTQQQLPKASSSKPMIVKTAMKLVTKQDCLNYIRNNSAPVVLSARKRGAFPESLIEDPTVAAAYYSKTHYRMDVYPLFQDATFSDDPNLEPASQQGTWIAKSDLGINKKG
jgi:hypothetical protein